MKGEEFILDDKVTFKELLQGLINWVRYFFSEWKVIFLAIIIGVIAGLMLSFFKKPVYHAETTFVLEETDMGALNQVSGLASVLGINLGSMSGPSGVFQGENILELYRSDNMLGTTLLSPMDESNLLIDRFIEFNKLDKKWSRKVDFSNLDFSKPRSLFTVTQDSVVKQISRIIREKHLIAEKPNRKLGIIKVTVSTKDEAFSKTFNETLVENVNRFYFETKTKKTAENLAVLQSQSDSVRMVLDENIDDLADLTDRIPFPNTLRQRETSESRKKQVDMQAAAAVYAEITKNLEIAKVNHRNNSPLIQIIDIPILPLKDTRIKPLKGMVFGGVLFGILAVLGLYIREFYRRHLAT